jgi:uncharacterized membrane protein
MNLIIETLQTWHVHPVADHFTVALVIIGVLTDLVGSLLPRFRWIRYMALTLMILGAAAAAASWVSGGWEAHRVHTLVTGEAKELLHDHAELGDWLLWIFIILAVWRIGVEALSFVAAWRGIYLLAAVAAAALLGYQGYLGGELVYDHGVGTALMTPTPGETPSQAVPTALPTVYVPPSPEASPAAADSSASSPTETATPTPEPSEMPSPSSTATPSATPTAAHV